MLSELVLSPWLLRAAGWQLGQRVSRNEPNGLEGSFLQAVMAGYLHGAGACGEVVSPLDGRLAAWVTRFAERTHFGVSHRFGKDLMPAAQLGILAWIEAM